MKCTYEELSPGMKKRMFELMKVRLFYKGSQNPELDAKLALGRMKKSKRAWHNKSYYFMKSIDMKREKLGLSPAYSPDEQKGNKEEKTISSASAVGTSL